MYRLGTLLLLALIFVATAQAQPSTLTLGCKGTTTQHNPAGDQDPQPISMGIIVNFTDHTVQGFGPPNGPFRDPLKIERANDVTVVFGGEYEIVGLHSIYGMIDRVTGDVWATWSFVDRKAETSENHMTYTLQCKPTQRMF
jgi:hypothetical protein